MVKTLRKLVQYIRRYLIKSPNHNAFPSVSLFCAETTGPILFCAVESTSDDSVVTALSRRVDWLSIDRQRLVACFHRDVE